MLMKVTKLIVGAGLQNKGVGVQPGNRLRCYAHQKIKAMLAVAAEPWCLRLYSELKTVPSCFYPLVLGMRNDGE
jgi:hypothetical protein